MNKQNIFLILYLFVLVTLSPLVFSVIYLNPDSVLYHCSVLVVVIILEFMRGDLDNC